MTHSQLATTAVDGGDAFACFGLERALALDEHDLDQRYRALMSKVHPDRFVQASDNEKRLALTTATTLNEAYRTLKAPLSRLLHLIALCGHDLGPMSGVKASPSLLSEQMALREEFDEAKGDHSRLYALAVTLTTAKLQAYQAAATALAANDWPEVEQQALALMFLEKITTDVELHLDETA